jgi:hypothetical protein
MDLPIKNIEDLRGAIIKLKGLEQEKSIALAQRFNSPSALFSTVLSLFSGGPSAGGAKSGSFFNQDIAGLLSRFVLPFTLNKTIFRNSGFIVKTLVGLVSQKASHFINEDMIAGLWDKVRTLFKSKTPEASPEHRGVPPMSEAS